MTTEMMALRTALAERDAEIARLREALAANRQSTAIALDVERAKVARLREAICAWAELEYMDKAHDPDRWERYLRAGTRLVEIAREGR